MCPGEPLLAGEPGLHASSPCLLQTEGYGPCPRRKKMNVVSRSPMRTHKGASRHQLRTRPLVGHLFRPVAFIATGMARHAPNASLWLPVRNRLSLRGYESGPAAWGEVKLSECDNDENLICQQNSLPQHSPCPRFNWHSQVLASWLGCPTIQTFCNNSKKICIRSKALGLIVL